MYTLTVTNNYVWQISANAGAVNIPERGGTHFFNDLGNVFLDIPGMGQMAFIDLAGNKLPGFPEITETWGVLVRANTSEAYYRYEGGGVLKLDIDGNGTATLSTTTGTLVPISLDELIVDVAGVHTN